MKKISLILPIFLLLFVGLANASISYITQSPVDLAQTLDTTPDFKFTPVSTVNATFDCTLFVDNTAYGNATATNNTETTITANDTLSSGDHNWYINCTDSDGTFQSEVRTIGIGAYFHRCAVLIDSGNYYIDQDFFDPTTGDCILIDAPNLSLDCQGHTITGNTTSPNGGNAIYSTKNGSIVKNCTLEKWNIGIGSGYAGGESSNSVIDSVKVLPASRGIYFKGCSNITIINSEVNGSLGGDTGIRLEGVTDSLIKNNEVYNFTFGSWTCCPPINHTTFENNYFHDNMIGLGYNGWNNSVINNTFDNNKYAIYIDNNNQSYVANNKMNLPDPLNQLGIWLVCEGIDKETCLSNTIEENNLINGKPVKEYKNIYGLTPELSPYSEVIVVNGTNSVIENAELSGLQIIYSDNLTINNITSKALISFYLENTNNSNIHSNRFYHEFQVAKNYYNKIFNNLFNGSFSYFPENLPNYWNTTRQTGDRIYSYGYEIGGNYWTNPDSNGYSDTCTDSDRDGFCDDPYDVYNDTTCTPGVDCSDNVDYLALSDQYCQCTDWSDSCVNTSTRYYTRTCTPAGCDIEEKYEYDKTCFSEIYGTSSALIPLIPIIVLAGLVIYLVKSLTTGISMEDLIDILVAITLAIALAGVLVAVIWF